MRRRGRRTSNERDKADGEVLLKTVPLVGLALLGMLCLDCSLHRRAGTGDVAFRLLWSGQSDLDLYVEDPHGKRIFFGNRESSSGGRLDIDCNAAPDRMCANPIENVYWPTGEAPTGEYIYWVKAHSLIPAEVPVRFELQVLEGQRAVVRHQGQIEGRDEIFGPFKYSFERR